MLTDNIEPNASVLTNTNSGSLREPNPEPLLNGQDEPTGLLETSNQDTAMDVVAPTPAPKRVKPTAPPGSTGIHNMGNTCYMNSAIQALSHNYPLTHYLFTKKSEIIEILKKNAAKILKPMKDFALDSTDSIVPMELRVKINDENYNPASLTQEETVLIINRTITGQLIKLLEVMWSRNCVVIPTCFKKIFSVARKRFFYGNQQHDAEEAYSCIVQQMQDELAQDENVDFPKPPSVIEFLNFKNEINEKIKIATSDSEKRELSRIYYQRKREMPNESMTVESYREMQKYYNKSFSQVTKIFTGFLHSSINCPNTECGYSSNKFEPFLHLSLPMPMRLTDDQPLTIEDCINQFCKVEQLDDKNLWKCEGCNREVAAYKRMNLWKAPAVLVIQMNRFGLMRQRKDTRFVKYPLEHLDISGMLSTNKIMSEGTCFKYRLQCVINHVGNVGSGHYFSYCMDEDTKRWFKFDDDSVKELVLSQVVTSSAYILFYIREDMIVQK